MPPEESPEAKYDRLKRQLQDSILSENPNPGRIGCPGDGALHRLSTRPSEEGVDDDVDWYHVTHCSECYREFLDLRRKFKGDAKKRSYATKWAIAAAVLAVAVGLFFASSHRSALSSERPQNAEVAYNKMTIDIPAMTRSEIERAGSPIRFERKAEEAMVNLPVGSKAGLYEFRLLKDRQPILSTHANAAIKNGTTSFSVKIDLSKIAPGTYSMSIRQAPWDWNYVAVVVQ